MAIRAVPGYNKQGYVYGGARLPGGRAICNASASKKGRFPVRIGAASNQSSHFPAGFTAPHTPGRSSVPSFESELTGDYMYDPTMKAYNAALQGGRDSLRDQIRQAVIRSGYDIRGKAPASLSSYLEDIDPTTMATADANQFSDK